MKTTFEVLNENPEFRKLLAIETLALEASGLIFELMEDQGVTKAELARRLNKSRAWITQLLSGKANMTVRTLAEVTHVLGAEVKLRSQHPTRGQQQPGPARTRHYVVEETVPSPSPGRVGPLKPGYAA